MDKQKEYVDKVIEQIVSETIIDYDKGRIDSPFSVFYHSDIIRQNESTYYFATHCRDVYGLDDDEVEYVWVVYKDIINNKLKRNKNTITESEKITVKDSIFLRKMIKYLKDNTKVVIEPFDIYDGYIIAPIGNGFRWDFEHKTIQPHGDFANEWWKEMLEVYGLSSKAVLIVMGVYMDFIWETLEKISDGRY